MMALSWFLEKTIVEQVALSIFFLFVSYVVWEQVYFLHFRIKHQVPGPGLVTPLVGCMARMVQDPHQFWEDQLAYDRGGVSYNSIFGKLLLFCTDPAISRKALTENGPDAFEMALHPNAVFILGKRNIAFMHGPEHKALRCSFLPLFSRKALGVYLDYQEELIRQHLAKWTKEATDYTEMRDYVRDLNLQTSQTVFVGPYLENPEEFSFYYLKMTAGFLSFPFLFPGTALWEAIKAKEKVIETLAVCVRKSKSNMADGAEPKCLLDFWVQRILKEVQEAEALGRSPPLYSEDLEMAHTVMDFLFASQDASTASLTWVLALMADHPDVLERVREEQERERGKDGDGKISYDVLGRLVYTRQVIKELLRFRPPAPMVPQVATRDIQLDEKHVAPKGSVVIPSLTAGCQHGFSDPERFDPDRMSEDRQEDIKYRLNYLVFGTGPHYCVGREYAVNHLVLFLSLLSTSIEWTRKRTPNSDKTLYLPTVYPRDCLIKIKAKAL